MYLAEKAEEAEATKKLKKKDKEVIEKSVFPLLT